MGIKGGKRISVIVAFPGMGILDQEEIGFGGWGESDPKVTGWFS